MAHLLTIKPTATASVPAPTDLRPKRSIIIGVEMPDGHRPVEHSFGTNVGVGGNPRYLRDRLGLGDVPVRKATPNELRRLHRMAIADMREMFPNGTIYARRSRVVG